MPPSRCALVVALALAAALLGGCTVAIPGRALASAQVSAGVDPGFIRGNDGGEDDRVAAAALTDLQSFWTTTFPSISDGRAMRPLAAFHSVDSTRTEPPVPCLRSPTQIEGNAFYCPRADILAYDRAALLPVLRDRFGDSAAVVVLAHEFGHAIQQRLDASSGGPGEAAEVPTILSEGQADCYGGLFLRQAREGRTPNVRTDAEGVDTAMAALVTFRDPVGTDSGDDNAHGNAFDRVSSFQQGFDGDAAGCAGMTVQNRSFTQTAFTSLQDSSTLGNLPLSELVASMSTDLDRFFGDLVRQRGRTWASPTVRQAAGACGDDGALGAGGVRLCPVGSGRPTIGLDDAALADQHLGIGDYATGTLLASRYGLAASQALGLPTTGAEAGRRALCLAGAYTGAVGRPGSGFSLSPGDLDESVQVLLRSDAAAADGAGRSGAATGYDRIDVFRGGVAGGPDACLGRA